MGSISVISGHPNRKPDSSYKDFYRLICKIKCLINCKKSYMLSVEKLKKYQKMNKQIFDCHPESELICLGGVNEKPEHSPAFLCEDVSANKR